MNNYDLRCSWCDQRFPDKQATFHHEKEEHGTVTDEQVNRIMSGQDKMWDTHSPVPKTDVWYPDYGPPAYSDGPFGPGLNVTVPRAVSDMVDAPNIAEDGRYAGLGDHFPVQERGPAIEVDVDTADELSDEEMMPELQRGLGMFVDPSPYSQVTAGAICQQAADITAGDRQTTHGDKLHNHENISALWGAYLGVEIDAHQAAMMMVLLKVARTKAGAFNTDDYVDAAGYAGCAAEIRHRSNQEQQ